MFRIYADCLAIISNVGMAKGPVALIILKETIIINMSSFPLKPGGKEI